MNNKGNRSSIQALALAHLHSHVRYTVAIFAVYDMVVHSGDAGLAEQARDEYKDIMAGVDLVRWRGWYPWGVGVRGKKNPAL